MYGQSATEKTGMVNRVNYLYRARPHITSLMAVFVLGIIPHGLCTAQNDIPVVITLKNSLELEGRTFKIDSLTRTAIQAFAQGRIQVVDDGLRRVYFNRNLIAVAPRAPANINRFETEIWQRPYLGGTTGAGRILSYGAFNEDGHRVFTVEEKPGEIHHFVQGITRMTADYCELNTLSIPNQIQKTELKWPMTVATSSIPPDVLRSVLHKTIQNRDNPDEYLNVVEFFLQAGLYRRALEEQEWVMRKFPGIREQQQNLTLLRQAYNRDLLNEVRFRRNTGQPLFAYSLAGAVNTEEVAGQTVAELTSIRTDIEQGRVQLDNARASVSQAIEAGIGNGKFDDAQVDVMRRFLKELETELRPTNLDRLDTFTRLLSDDTLADEEKMALAISGWLLGGNKAIRNFATTLTLFPVRDIVIDYLNSTPGQAGAMRRAELISELESLEGGVPEYLVPMINVMKPPRHDRTDKYTAEKPIEFFVSIPRAGGGTEQVSCLAHLPPEYDPYRKYPCLMTLRPGINTEAQLDRWCGSVDPNLQVEPDRRLRTGRAMRNGYVVVSVDWKKAGTNYYPYSAREHAIVLRALRETLRSFAVDSDRIFLSGHSIGATAAYDIAIAHPEHWAGVIGIGGKVSRYSDQYRANKHINMPVYAVLGGRDADSFISSAPAFNVWLQSDNYLECMVIVYKGRSEVTYNRAGLTAEEFVDEMPEIMRWMNAQRRIRPGREFEFVCKTLRPWDNYFWFWELTGIPEENITRPEHWADTGHNGIKISGKLKSGNRFTLGPSNRGTGGILMLSPDNVDFKEKIVINGRGSFNNMVDASSRIILEDVRTRGDRQHPYWAKLNCNGKAWTVDD